MVRKINRLLGNNVNSIRFTNVESAKDKFYKQLQKQDIDDNGFIRYNLVMNYSNQIDALNVQFLATICTYLYSKNENIVKSDIDYLTSYTLGNPKNYSSEEEYNIDYVKMSMTTIRYIYHVIDCINQAKINQDVYDLNIDYEQI